MERTYSDERMENETVYLIFGQNVKAYRKKRGRTQEELAATLDCDQKYVSRLENGYARPTLDICLRIANFLQVSIDDLLEGVSAAARCWRRSAKSFPSTWEKNSAFRVRTSARKRSRP